MSAKLGATLGGGWQIAVEPYRGPAAEPLALHIPGDAADLLMRTWQPGDRVAPSNGHVGGKLQDWFTDQHIPSYARHHLALLARGDRILWIVGLAAFLSPAESATGAEESGATAPLELPPAEVPPGLDGAFAAAARGAVTLRLLYNGTAVEPTTRP